MSIKDIEIKFNKRGLENQSVLDNFEKAKVQKFIWGGPDYVDVIISPYKKGMSLDINGLYNFELSGGITSFSVNEIPITFSNMKIEHLTVNEEKETMVYEFRKSKVEE